jgi:Kef-type K+ transport system membrane component KefB
MTGELVAGVLLGILVHQNTDWFPVFSQLGDNEVFTAVTDLAVLFIMLAAGVEMRPSDLTKSSGRSLAVAAGGMALPLGLGIGVGLLFVPASEYRLAQVVFLGTALAVTAVPVAVKILMDLDMLKSRSGKLMVSAAIFDDVLSLMLLAVLTALIETGAAPDLAGIGMIVLNVVLFFGITTLCGAYVLPLIFKLVRRWWIEELEFSVLLIVALAFAVLAEMLHLHFILGAFVAGLFFSRRDLDDRVYFDVEKKVNGISTGFLAPLFFASIGLHLDISAFQNAPVFLTLLLIVAVVGKLAGAGIPARLFGLSWRESAVVGSGMSARGAVELVIADIALRAGLFSKPEPVPAVISNLFSAVVIMAIVTTLLAPILMRMFLKEELNNAANDRTETGA